MNTVTSVVSRTSLCVPQTDLMNTLDMISGKSYHLLLKSLQYQEQRL